MELKNRSFQYGKVALAVPTQYHQLQFGLKVVAICTDTCISLVQTVRSLLQLADFLPADPVASICRRSLVHCWTRPVLVRKFLQHLSGTVTLTLPQDFDQYSVLFSKNRCFLRQPNTSQKCNQHYGIIRSTSCSKYANRYFPYWKILFLSSIL